MLKKSLFAAVTLAALAAASPARAACDISKLEENKDYDPKFYSQLQGPADKENFCLARTLVKRVKNGEQSEKFNIKDIPVRMSRFVSSEEYDSCRDVLIDVMSRGSAGKMA